MGNTIIAKQWNAGILPALSEGNADHRPMLNTPENL